MSDLSSNPVFMSIYAYFLTKSPYLPTSNPAPKHGIQYLRPNPIVCNFSTQNLRISVSNRHLSHKNMVYNTHNALSDSKFGRETPESCRSSVENRGSVLYAIVLPIAAVLSRSILSHRSAIDTEDIRAYLYVRHIARSLLCPECGYQCIQCICLTAPHVAASFSW